MSTNTDAKSEIDVENAISIYAKKNSNRIQCLRALYTFRGDPVEVPKQRISDRAGRKTAKYNTVVSYIK